MKRFIMLLSMGGVMVGCETTPAVSEHMVAKITEWKQNDYGDSPLSSLNSADIKLQVKYERPLKAPFKFFADLRCLKNDGVLEVWKDQGIQTLFNVPPSVFSEVTLSWSDFNPTLYSVCQVRLFDHDPSRGKDVSDQLKFFARFCHAPEIVEPTKEGGLRVINFKATLKEKCSFDK